jgi:hypothetical protein
MDNSKHKQLVSKARTIYRVSLEMQKVLLDMFLDEFIELDEREEKIRIQQLELPF